LLLFKHLQHVIDTFAMRTTNHSPIKCPVGLQLKLPQPEGRSDWNPFQGRRQVAGGGAQKKKKQLPLQAENVAETFSTGESFDVALSSAK